MNSDTIARKLYEQDNPKGPGWETIPFKYIYLREVNRVLAAMPKEPVRWYQFWRKK